MDFLPDARVMADELVALRRTLHRVPEIGLHLPKTQQIVLDALDGLPLEISTGKDLTSVTAVLRGKPGGPVVLLRGDMDALPIVEETGEPFAADPDSEHGTAMHACGHDLHTTGLVGAARLLSAHRAELPGDVVFMFQPGEEGYDGAGHMVKEGVLEAAGRPVDAAFALHVSCWMADAGIFCSRPGPMFSASSALTVKVVGVGGHGSMPYRSHDPIPAAAEMVLALQSLVTRRFDVFDPVILTIGSIHGGTRRNVIPDSVEFDTTVRTYSAEAAERMREESVRLCTSIAEAHGLTAEVTFAEETLATWNDEKEYQLVQQTVTDLFGAQRMQVMPNPMAGSEDFSRVLSRVPGAYVYLGAAVGDHTKAASSHSSLAIFDDSVLPEQAALLATLAYRWLCQG